ncbi:HAD hydrolase-like protein [Sphingomonas sp. 28-63-12]|uniref:HAD hydrolase-like protein n=1 Tax=Sphingomonas sp. 28-63-12 TaxID=1970434 RepID=UPI000BC8D4E9|nr:MAG: HAD family hydrolase [Sphingomonas sp. 28-63-12]
MSAPALTLAAAATGATPRYRLAIFDFDGTLADSGDWFLSIADDLAERFRFRRVDSAEVEALRGRTTREVIRHVGIPRWKLPAIARHIHKRLADETDRIELFDGVAAMIDQLVANGVRIAVVTSNAEHNARAILGPALVAKIEMFECGASLFGKAPRFKRVLRKLGVAHADAISIGDETRDLTAARKVGIDAAAVLWGYANRNILTALNPDAVFDSPAEVIAFMLGNQHEAVA